MAELQSALKSLGPTDWDSVPTSEAELDSYLADLFADSQLILDSVPIPEPDENTKSRSRANTQNSATKAAEIFPSAERSAPATAEYQKLEKEWGKSIKLKQSENPLGMSVYKLAGKDGKGAWFARRSVHEGIGYTQFKKSLELEFPQSMSEPGPPGTGNIRGIGGEEKVEDIKVQNKGQIEVYRLSAQFPGPTTPRDFVTMLVTSNKAMKTESVASDAALAPRHYMIISKPCNHPKTQPQNGFIRGYYESVEFIREVPRKLKASQSSLDLNKLTHDKDTENLEKEVQVKKLDQKSQTFAPGADIDGAKRPVSDHGDSSSRRNRAVTVGSPVVESEKTGVEAYDPENNPVEWIMITRSDPGGSVPRFMVERGTPGSICADAVKFLDWATQNDFSEESGQGDAITSAKRVSVHRRESFQSWRARSTVGVEEYAKEEEGIKELHSDASRGNPPEETTTHGIWDTVTGAAASLRPYAPQVVLDHLPQNSADTTENKSTAPPTDENDAASIQSTTSFLSAEDHVISSVSSSSNSSAGASIPSGQIDPEADASSKSSKKDKAPDPATEHEKQLAALNTRRETLARRHADSITKLHSAAQKTQTASESAMAKSRAKHDKELKKHEEKYARELAKLEQKAEKERKKLEEKNRRNQDKDEKARLTRERDEARSELELVKKEVDELKELVKEVQAQNTKLVMKLGKAGLISSSDSELTMGDAGNGSKSAASSMKGASVKST